MAGGGQDYAGADPGGAVARAADLRLRGQSVPGGVLCGEAGGGAAGANVFPDGAAEADSGRIGGGCAGAGDQRFSDGEGPDFREPEFGRQRVEIIRAILRDADGGANRDAPGELSAGEAGGAAGADCQEEGGGGEADCAGVCGRGGAGL